MPCKKKDCAGMKMTLSLKNRQNYLIVTQNAQSSSREYYEKGKYSWDDKSGIVTLVARKDSSIRKFSIKNEARLIMLEEATRR
ncbi:MAG: copper resistance protein NlpE N-terminal domain-containing protein [Candidatus Methanofishera endochildressiae]|uniref:Copper resistance protein NlpE N-terminal domain-containing protein n=1 Tax=Candidatus Methanofishera endochildressiae TaxID=2738884 RepID=A0A7Z0MQL3_9GAMM|nr:copper resistance protein NlpE N-terminal domain-containing protein [Candidatus Methanofishera endochildressiae]